MLCMTALGSSGGADLVAALLCARGSFAGPALSMSDLLVTNVCSNGWGHTKFYI